MGLIEGQGRDRLARFLGAAAGGAATIAGARRLGGGAIQVNWRIDVSFAGGPMAGDHALVVRASAPGRVIYSHTRDQEFALLEAAFGAGVTVPEPLWACDDAAVIGAPFLVSRFVEGISLAQKIVRDPALDGARDALAGRLCEELAKIHGIRPGHAGLDFLARPEPSPAAAAIAAYRTFLDGHDAPHPAIEWGLRWAERNAPPPPAEPPAEIVLCHRDFRTGNYVVDPGTAGGAAGQGALTGILDWEFSGWGDPMEDVAWFCAKCWRFGANHREAGGIASRARFHDAYRGASGRDIDADAIRFWEVMAHARWAVIALMQAERHLSGAERSLELAAIGRRPAEMELEILRLTGAA